MQGAVVTARFKVNPRNLNLKESQPIWVQLMSGLHQAVDGFEH